MALEIQTTKNQITVAGPVPSGDSVDGRPYRWKVLRLVNSIDYAPGEIISADAVRTLCNLNNWTVHVVPLEPEG